ncbi:hypothetical protein [uncultured Treponema sp.]|nr:hypothetical protein [uncultured Treponema sp.]
MTYKGKAKNSFAFFYFPKGQEKIMWSGVFVKVWERLKGASNREAA